MGATKRATGRRSALGLLVLGLFAAVLAAPGTAAAAGGDVAWTFSLAGDGADHATAIPAGPGGSAFLCGDGRSAGAMETVALLESESKTLQWGLAWGADVAGGAWCRAAAYDPRSGGLYLVTSVSDPMHIGALAIVKTDSAGRVAWTRSYSTLSESLPYASEAVVDGHGNLYVAGVTNLPGAGGWTEAFVVKLSARGDLLWERTWGRAVEASMAVALTVTPAGRAYCAGWVSRGGDLVTPYVRAFNGSGRKLWSRGFAASSGARWASDLAQAPGGAVVVVGGRVRGGTSQGVVEKYDGGGRTLWRRAVSTGAEGSSLGSAAVDDRGRVFAAGVYGSPESGRGGALVIGLSSSGRARWTSQWHDQAWPGEIVVAGPRLYMDASLAPEDA
jgi:outer membrane protein assembly factor BamB